jgi:hypothetical protein
MRRREFIVGWWDGGLVSRGGCGAQQPAMPMVGVRHTKNNMTIR